MYYDLEDRYNYLGAGSVPWAGFWHTWPRFTGILNWKKKPPQMVTSLSQKSKMSSEFCFRQHRRRSESALSWCPAGPQLLAPMASVWPILPLLPNEDNDPGHCPPLADGPGTRRTNMQTIIPPTHTQTHTLVARLEEGCWIWTVLIVTDTGQSPAVNPVLTQLHHSSHSVPPSLLALLFSFKLRAQNTRVWTKEQRKDFSPSRSLCPGSSLSNNTWMCLETWEPSWIHQDVCLNSNYKIHFKVFHRVKIKVNTSSSSISTKLLCLGGFLDKLQWTEVAYIQFCILLQPFGLNFTKLWTQPRNSCTYVGMV